MIISRRTGRKPFTPQTNRISCTARRKVSGSFRVEKGVASAQGPRPTMEDAHVSATFHLPSSAVISGSIQFHAVFDGHGGSTVSQWLQREMVKAVERFLMSESTVERALQKACETLDQVLVRDRFDSGSTCIALLIEERTQTAWVMNVGDSRCVFSNRWASKDHKPTTSDEQARIDLAGGWVVNNRVSGLLAVSRAFGDWQFKPVVTAEPEITKINLDKQKFAILACDGMWDVLSNDIACSLAGDGFRIGAAPSDVAWGLVHAAINEKKSTDNVSVIVLKFQS